ncbi:MAG: hypothetical protein FWF44_05020 [Defluviitaleaceae bacterium]|nr:hypothetical protein [Defluviitaleaceae bacterium]
MAASSFMLFFGVDLAGAACFFGGFALAASPASSRLVFFALVFAGLTASVFAAEVAPETALSIELAFSLAFALVFSGIPMIPPEIREYYQTLLCCVIAFIYYIIIGDGCKLDK